VLAHDCSLLSIIVILFTLSIEVYDKLAFILQETSLNQDFSHCSIFQTAASKEFRPFLSSDVAGHSLKPARNRRLGALLITPTTTCPKFIIFSATLQSL